MSIIQKTIRTSLFSLGIVLMTALSSCGGGGATTNTATDGTTITAGAPSVSYIYISNTANTNQKSSLRFSVTKAGVAVPNMGVTATLNSQALAAGVTFLGGATSLNLVTDASGSTAIFYVIAGAIPTSVVVKGALVSNASVADFSSAIAVSSGGADQSRFSMANGDSSIEGWNYLGSTTTTTVQLADRLGNPVPNGTSVNFTSGPGVIVSPTTCMTTDSACSVTLTTANAVGRTPLVTILAYAQGEESFVDSNGNNQYDLGESFTDLGMPYRDDNQNGIYDGTDQAINTIGLGTNACPATTSSLINSVPNTCNGIRDSNAIVRAQSVLYVAPSNPALNLISSTASSKTFELYVQIPGSTVKYRAPSGTTVSAVAVLNANVVSACAVTMDNVDITATASNATVLSQHTMTYTLGSCSGQQAKITVTTPKGKTFNLAVNL